MAIVFSEKTQEIHIFNRWISYIIQIMDNGELSNLYFGKRIGHKDDFSYLLEGGLRSLAVYTKENDYFMSPQYTQTVWSIHVRERAIFESLHFL
mgnify:CR=1 FL=1